MAEHGDRTGSTNTLEKSISRERTGEIDELIHMSTSHESADEEECDACDSTNQSRCNQTAELGESRRFDLGVWRPGQKDGKRSPGAIRRFGLYER